MTFRDLAILAAAAMLFGAPFATRAPGGAPGDADWADRLERLRPEDTLAYFELAEEVADAAEDEGERSLARYLFSLAGVLDPDRLARSACLALADLEADEIARRRLLALASLLGRGDLGRPISDAGGGLGAPPSTSAILGVCDSFSYYRRGEGPRAMSALKAPGATTLFESCDRFLPGGVRRYREDGRLYRGRIRPDLSESELVQLLRLERALLAGAERGWSSDLLLSRGRPLVEVDPARIAQTLRADPRRPLHRNGRWVAVGDTP